MALGVSVVCTAGSAQYSSVSKFLNLIVRDFDLLCSPVLRPLFQLLMTGSDESGYCMADEMVFSTLVLLCTDHSQLGKLPSFSKGG